MPSTSPAPSPALTTDAELDRQLQSLVDLGYPALTDRSEASFRALVEPLRELLPDAVRDRERRTPTVTPARADFLLVVHPSLVPPSRRVPLLSLAGREGELSRHFGDVDSFAAVPDVPDAPVYAVLDVDRGDDFLGVPPTEAVATLAERGRTPLTVVEGMALLHAIPAALEKNRCFHTAGSRGTDRRVPALWISGARRPHLGWCWENNHHTWLGVASAAERLAPAV